MKFGDHFSYIGGSFSLTPDRLEKAIDVTKKELKQHQKRLQLWENNPEHQSFAHDMEWHGAETIDMLVRGHVIAAKKILKTLKSLRESQLHLNL